MVVARVVSGLGMGFINATVPVLQAEFSPKTSRGIFACAQVSTLNFGKKHTPNHLGQMRHQCLTDVFKGIMMVYWIDFAFQSTGSDASYTWRVPTILQCTFLFPMIFLVLIIPETPHWLASKDRNEEAHDVLRRMNEHKMSHEEIALLHSGILESVALAHGTRKAGWSDLFKTDCMLQTRYGIHPRQVANFLQACTVEDVS